MDSIIELQHKKHIAFLQKEFNYAVVKDSFNLFLFSYVMPVSVIDMKTISGDSFSKVNHGYYNSLFADWIKKIFKTPPVHNLKYISHINYYLCKSSVDMDLLYYYFNDSIYEYKVYETGNAFLFKIVPKNKEKVILGKYYNNLCFEDFKTNSNTQVKKYDYIEKYSNVKDYGLNGDWFENITIFENTQTKNVHILIMKTWTPRQSMDFIYLRNNWISPVLDSCYKKPERLYKFKK